MKTWIHLGSLLVAALGIAGAAEVASAQVTVGEKSAQISFKEPVVPKSALYRQTGASVEIQPSAGSCPSVLWSDQDTLHIRFDNETEPGATYRLELHENRRKYLSGKAMPQHVFHFNAPPCIVEEVKAPGLSWGIPGGAVMLRIDQDIYRHREKLLLSDVEYCFEVTGDDDEPDRMVPGKARAVLVKEVPERLLASCMSDAAEVDWAALTPDSVVPGIVVVEPVESLAGCFWELHVKHPDELVKTDDSIMGTFAKEFRCCPLAAPGVQEGRERLYMELCFNAPVLAADAEQIFRSLGITSGEQVAEASADGRSKVLRLEGQEIRFTYAPLPETRTFPLNSREQEHHYVELPLHMTNCVGMWVDGAQHLPVPLQLTLPAGTCAANGLRMQEQQVIPFALNTLRPVLPECENKKMILMPWKGAHHLKMKCSGCGSIEVRAARLDAEQYVRLHDSLRSLLSWGSDEAKQELAPLFGKKKVFSVPHGEKMEQEIELPLDEVEGFGQKPGVYVLAMKPASPSGVKPVVAPGSEPEDEASVQYYVVHASDMVAYTINDQVLAMRLSDSSLVQDGELKIYGDGYNFSSKLVGSFPLHNGVARPVMQEQVYPGVALVQSGDDFALLKREWMGITRKEEMVEKGSVQVFADRSLYRPGDTLHLYAMTRRWDEQGKMAPPAAGERVQVRILRKSKVCYEKTLQLDAYGSAHLDWRLPTEPEDAVGEYEVTVCSEGCADGSLVVNCEVFRRDAFDVKCELIAEAVQPESAVLKVQAMGYDGLPVTDGVVHAEVYIEGDDEPCRVDLPLDAAGCAEHVIDLSCRSEWIDGEKCSVCVLGSVRNSRQEYVMWLPVSRNYYPADFLISCTSDGLQTPVIVLTDISDEKRPLAREQELELSLLAPVYNKETLSNGVVLITSNEQGEVWQQRITVPAHCTEGVKPELEPILRKLKEERKRRGDRRTCTVKLDVRGEDPDGNMVTVQIPVLLKMHDDSAWLENRETDVECVWGQVEGRELVIPTSFSCAGKAAFMFRTKRGILADTVPVQAGQNTVRVALPDNAFGNVSGTILLPIQKAGVYHGMEAVGFVVDAPTARKKLAVEWQLPPGVQAPGSRVQVSGRVMGADGSPVEQASVCLWAVDTGMLSVSRYTLPTLGAGMELSLYWDSCLPKVGEYTYTLPELHQVVPAMSSYYPQGLLSALRGLGDDDIYFDSQEMDYYAGRCRVRCNFRAQVLAEVDALWSEEDAELGTGLGSTWSGLGSAGSVILASSSSPESPRPRLRTDFTPTPLWQPVLRSDAEGRFTAELLLPDTFTTYRVMAVVQGADGCSFGNGKAELVVNQPVMLEPGTPFFMSVGDTLRLPVTVTNNSGAEGTWAVSMQGAAAPQQVTLDAGQVATLYFEFTAMSEGECVLQWQAVGENGSDAVQGSFPVRFPAPVLQEAHHVALKAGDAPLVPQELLGDALRSGRNLRVVVELCADPLAQLRGCLEFSLTYPYGCTEQRSSTLLPWLLYERLAPYCRGMKNKSAEDVKAVVEKTVAVLLKRQQADGGLSYWDSGESCYWASAQAAQVLTIARTQGYDVPADALKKLCDYLSRNKANHDFKNPFTRYAVASVCEDDKLMTEALAEATAEKQEKSRYHSRVAQASLRFLSEMDGSDEAVYEAYNRWLRTVAGGAVHLSTWDSGWVFLALHEFMLFGTEKSEKTATLTTAAGRTLTVGAEPVVLSAEDAATLTPTAGTAYVTVKAKALPEQTEYPGVTEKGLQVTRIYEKRGEDGVWREAHEFNVGDVVRVTLTCAKGDRELEYFVLEDYLPASMEAINPNVPSQAAGLEWSPWSYWFDHKEYLSYRVRGFCTRWGGRDLLNMSYYARVKRAGTATAPPAQAQLMYEPQTYGLSPNAVITTR